MKILFVEDDNMLGDATSTYLKQDGYIVDWVKDGETALRALKYEKVDLILLDLGLPLKSGHDILKFLQKNKNSPPVIVLTAKDEIDDKVTTLDLGADDYITKPYNLEEITARIRAIQRRHFNRKENKIKVGNVTIDLDGHMVYIGKEDIKLSRREYTLFQRLMEQHDKVVGRDTLIQTLYSWDEEIDSNTIEVHIHHLRKKFSDHLNIQTIRGVGYRLEKK
ncbi:MAG: response regulator transcription factor [Pseudomonadota bacterium]|nr:response regulator transcription factor [Pseudomonadota bacterium]